MDGLRFTYLIECAEKMRFYNKKFRKAAWKEDAHVARAYFEAMRSIGKDIETTLREIEAIEKPAEREAA